MLGRDRNRRAAHAAPKSKGRAAPSSSDSGPKHARDDSTARSRTRGISRLAIPAVLVVLTVAALLLYAFPTRTYLDQRRVASISEQRLAELEAANADAQAEVDALQSDAEIERIAREQYGYAKAGEEVYHVLPPARDPVRVPDAWPFNGLGTTLER